jgi:protease I
MNALIISADNFEDSELLVPYYRFLEAGLEVALSSFRAGKIKGKHGYEVVVDWNLVTSREPADLPAFMREIMKLLKG